MKRLTVVCVTLLALVWFGNVPAQAGVDATTKIYGGTTESISEFPWAVRVIIDTANGSTYGCGGAILNEEWVLSAAHCVVDDNLPSKIRILYGSADISTPGSYDIATVDKIIIHPGHLLQVAPTYSDVALFHLSEDISQSPATLIEYNDSDSLLTTGNTARVVGWGATETAGSSDVLLGVDVPIVDFTTGSSKYTPGIYANNQNFFYAGGVEGKDSCFGDSGGPIMVKNATNDWVTVGVVAFGASNCGTTTPAGYSNIAKIMDWIEFYTKGIQLVKGWNLVSTQSDSYVNVTSLTANASNVINSYWAWVTNSTGAGWSVYLPGQDTASYAAAKGFSVLGSIKPGQGFWVNSEANATLRVE